jgi:hypothetical protein
MEMIVGVARNLQNTSHHVPSDFADARRLYSSCVLSSLSKSQQTKTFRQECSGRKGTWNFSMWVNGMTFATVSNPSKFQTVRNFIPQAYVR